MVTRLYEKRNQMIIFNNNIYGDLNNALNLCDMDNSMSHYFLRVFAYYNNICYNRTREEVTISF